MRARIALALHHDPRGEVGEPDRARRLVVVLAAGAARPEHVLADVLVADLDLGVVVGDLRGHVDGRETRLPLPFSIEGADADESVDAGLALEVAVGPRSTDCHGRALNAGHSVVLAIEELDRVVVLRRPGRIHPQQHLGPVVGVGAAVAGVDRHQGVAGVVGAREQRREFERIDHLLEAIRLGGEIGLERGVFPGEFLEGLEVAAGGDRLLERLEHRVDRLQLRDGCLGPLLVVPEVGPAHRSFEAGGGLLASVPVKGSPAAGAGGPGSRRSG